MCEFMAEALQSQTMQDTGGSMNAMSAREYTWRGRFGPMQLQISDHTFTPSTISTLMAEELVVADTDVVIDVGCGSGILSIVAAKLGADIIYGVDASPDVVEVATANATAHGVADRTRFHQGDLFDPLPSDLQADVIIGDVSGIPDTLAAFSGWFPSGTGGGASGSELPIAMLEAARTRLKPGGRLYLPTGTLQDEQAILETARRVFGSVEHLSERVIPLPGQLADSEVVRDLVSSGVVTLGQKGSRFTWTARVWLVTVTTQ